MKTALPFAHRLRFEAAVAIAGCVDLHWTDLGDQRLGTGPVLGAGAVAALYSMLLIAEMLLHLDLQTCLKDLLRQLAQKAVRADQIDPLDAGLFDEPLRDLRIDLRRQPQLGLLVLRRHSAILICHHQTVLPGNPDHRSQPFRPKPVTPAIRVSPTTT